MAFPVSPTNGQQATIANTVYQYTTASNSWTVVPGYANTITATGNINANYFIGNGSQLTGIVSTGATQLTYGTSNMGFSSSGSNANISVGGSANIAVFSTGGANITGYITASGNITGSYILGNGSQLTGIDATSIQSGTSNVRVSSSGGNVTVGIGGSSNIAVFSTGGANITGYANISGNISGGNSSISGVEVVTGNITGGNLITAGILSVNSGNSTGSVIRNAGGNGVGNIGGAGAYFNTIHAKATSAQYADVAEKYLTNTNYPVGTVMSIGGPKEVTASRSYHDSKVVGTISENPAYIMNGGLEGEYIATVAFLGRVPCRVTGTILRGDLLVSSEKHGIATVLDPDLWQPGCVLGKALEDYDSDQEGVIEIIVGKI